MRLLDRISVGILEGYDIWFARMRPLTPRLVLREDGLPAGVGQGPGYPAILLNALFSSFPFYPTH